eukprot:scaffold3055_cov402-Prasinococcus_capsulatus_cf.AAC.10
MRHQPQHISNTPFINAVEGVARILMIALTTAQLVRTRSADLCASNDSNTAVTAAEARLRLPAGGSTRLRALRRETSNAYLLLRKGLIHCGCAPTARYIDACR